MISSFFEPIAAKRRIFATTSNSCLSLTSKVPSLLSLTLKTCLELKMVISTSAICWKKTEKKSIRLAIIVF